MRSRTSIYIVSASYGLCVFTGTALLGFLIAPFLGIATGLFVIDAEARAFFSLLTLKGVPYLLALSVVSGVLYDRFSSRRIRTRVATFGLDVVIVWLFGASIALAILG
jgi:hypothetical protein